VEWDAVDSGVKAIATASAKGLLDSTTEVSLVPFKFLM